MKKRDLGYAYLMVAFSAILYGCESVTVKLAYGGGWTVFSLMAARFTVAMLVFAAAVKLSGSPWLVEKGQRWPTLKLCAVYICAVICLYQAYDYLSPALATLFFYAYPSMTAIVSRLVYKKPLHTADIVALVLSAVGLILLYWSSVGDISMIGVMFALLSASFQGFRYNMSERLMPKVTLVTYNFNNVTVVTIVGWLICLLGGAGDFAFSAVSATGWVTLLALGLVITSGATFLTMKYIPKVGAVVTSLLMLLEPPMAAGLGWLVFGDELSGWQLVGGGLILASVMLPVIFREKSPEINA